MKTIAAGGFKDITRIASSSPVMWENICLSNQEQILRLIDSFCEELGHMRSAIAASDSKALMEAFTSAKDYRDSLTLHANGTLKQVYELYMDLLDEAGGIATVATILASHHLSIKNIGIIHNREFEDGVLHLEMYDSESLAAAITLLKKHHYTEVARIVLEGVGGKENIESIDNCITRLRLEIRDYTKVDEKKIKSAGVAGVVRPSQKTVQVIIGTQVQFVADEFKKLCK